VDQQVNDRPCKRPYDLGRRQEVSDRTREAVLAAARAQLETSGALTMEALAKASGVSRQTIHNLFGTRSSVLEALFDRMAVDSGMMRMAEVMTAPDGERMLAAMVEVFAGFWARDRMLLKRIHGIAAIDEEMGRLVEARNRRRVGISGRVVERLFAGRSNMNSDERAGKVAALTAMTSFEFFDALAESCGNAETAAAMMLPLVRRAVE